ncbi:MAG: GNAT family N-acetyltransferase [Ruminococcaceae bacterium]|nr:GNAT family N-acetyltransferase [Oscillospiraceae bacterium]
MIKAAEKYAAESGINKIWIHSQEQAAGFYSALGYKDIGIHDVEEGCPHILMKKVL